MIDYVGLNPRAPKRWRRAVLTDGSKAPEAIALRSLIWGRKYELVFDEIDDVVALLKYAGAFPGWRMLSNGQWPIVLLSGHQALPGIYIPSPQLNGGKTDG